MDNSISKKSALVALLGCPNAGKTSLFNALTGASQKIANYPGVTVERKIGQLKFASGHMARLVDLPGTYSLTPISLDEEVTNRAVRGQQDGLDKISAIIAVVDANNLDNHLPLILEAKSLGIPMIIALNMVDMAARDGLTLSPQALETALGIKVVETVAVRKRGLTDLTAALEICLNEPAENLPVAMLDDKERFAEAHRLAKLTILKQSASRLWTQTADRILLHPVGGIFILLGLLFIMFQAVYSWSEAPIGWIESGTEILAAFVANLLPAGFFSDLITQGVIAGVGSVIVFLPQILILFLFILLLESTGYMTRAAFLMDRFMASAGMSGHSFIPLLSSFACAIPGIMATRSIADDKQRLTTILVAPLMTCSARLPVYTVIIGAFIPKMTIGPNIGLQGFVLFCLYLAGIIAAMIASIFIRKTAAKGAEGTFLLEMPRYQMPRMRDILISLWQRGWVFLRRAGTIIMAATIILWLLLTFPKVDGASSDLQSQKSYAGQIASVIEPVVRPIGFNQEIALALIPAMAAREVAVSALATVNAIDAEDEEKQSADLGKTLAGKWSLATALAFLAWFVFAPQCISTIAVAKRETNGWKWPLFMLAYLFALAYLAAGITYWTAVAFGLG
ncbi:ferrous iron transporter B [Sphingorhabdus lutea]|uniref:Ferrous iron transport protein B n=1 Tax=Sphingorhabdus lutea TaxID=1913578 RepID=A0A1L3J9C7_9SPHN|nr:ferrous iron transporter B [Sphingorhabdus lutea]APG61742.1 ferrous iron transporter B [Sphingorhabdus lutea]